MISRIKDVRDFFNCCDNLEVKYHLIDGNFTDISEYVDVQHMDTSIDKTHSVTFIIDYDAFYEHIDPLLYHANPMNKHLNIKTIINAASMKNVHIIFLKKNYTNKKFNDITPCDKEYDITMNILRYCDPAKIHVTDFSDVPERMFETGGMPDLIHNIITIEYDPTRISTFDKYDTTTDCMIGRIIYMLMDNHVVRMNWPTKETARDTDKMDYIHVIANNMALANRNTFFYICENVLTPIFSNGSNTKQIDQNCISQAEKVLVDNGIEKDEASIVLQAIGYAFDVELYPDN